MAFYHVFNEVENRRTGVPMAGVQVEVLFQGTGTAAPIYADEAGTPFVPDNYCVTDADGMYSFYIDAGEYRLNFLIGSQVIKTIDNFTPTGQVSPSGPANSTYATTAGLKGAQISNLSAILTEIGKAGTFVIRDTSDFTDQIAADIGEVNYIVSTAVPENVWVRASILPEGASFVGMADGGTVEEAVTSKASAAALGVSSAANDMGTFSGSIISDNVSAKSALQELETALESTSGSVTSVGLSVPTGFSVGGSPVTASGTIAITYAAGYQGYTATEASKLAGISAGAQVNTVNSVNSKTGAVVLAKADVGLGNVDNTSDANKPVSTATQTALNAKASTKAVTTSANGLMIAADKVKLNGIATGATANTGTVTSVAMSGGTTGLTFSGGPVTTSGTFTAEGILAIGNGGTGGTTASSARINLDAVGTTGSNSLSGAYRVIIPSTLTGTSIKPNMAVRNMFTYTNAAAFTLTAPASDDCYTAVVEITNAAGGAGAITASGFTYADTSAFTTDANARFIAQITSFGSGKKYLHIVKAS